jgi:putative hydrolase
MDIDPVEIGMALSSIPLFRELQRLLMAQSSPVNWEIAGQISTAVAQMRGSGDRPGPEEQAEFEEACRLAEMRVGQLTGLESPGSITKVEVVDRVEWAQANLEAIRPFMERLSAGLGGALSGGLGNLGGLGGLGGMSSSEEEAAAVPMSAALGMLGPLIFGLEVGFLMGFLSRRVLGQYDLCLPRGDGSRLYFVYPNIAEAQASLELDARQFRMWLALHEVTHQLEFAAIPWVRSHFTGLVERFIDAAEIDSGEAMSRLQSLGDPEQLSHLMSHPEELLPMLITPPQQELARQIETLMALLEGYTEWVMDQVGSELLPEFSKIREGLNRRKAERSSVERLLEGLLGIDLKPAQYRQGERFVRAVAGADQLSKLWESSATLPTPAELGEPTKWLSRVAFS